MARQKPLTLAPIDKAAPNTAPTVRNAPILVDKIMFAGYHHSTLLSCLNKYTTRRHANIKTKNPKPTPIKATVLRSRSYKIMLVLASLKTLVFVITNMKPDPCTDKQAESES